MQLALAIDGAIECGYSSRYATRHESRQENLVSENNQSKSTRRGFLQDSTKLTAAAAVAGSMATPNLSIARSAHAFGTDTIKIGLIGCGGRGTGAAIHAMNTKGSVNLVAMADAFENRLEDSHRSCSKLSSC